MLDENISSHHLSEDQKEAYWRDGYLYPLPVVSAGQAANWRAELEKIERDWLNSDLPLPLNTYKRVNANVVMPLAHEIATAPSILDVVEGVLGENIMIYAAEFFIKEPRTQHVVSMHQDLTYWGMGEIDGLTTAWLALSDVTKESGCMDFVAGSHKNPILPHEDTFSENNLLSRGQEIQVDVAEEDKAVVALKPGELSLHHGLTIHGSGPNSSDDRRIGVAIRYIASEMANEHGQKDYAKLARGKDFGNFHDFPTPTALFAKENLAAYDEMRAHQAKVMMAGAASSSKIYD